MLLITAAIIGIVGLGVILARPAGADDRPWFGGFGFRGFRRGLEPKAEFLGMTPEELKAQLEEKTIFEIMEEQGISPEQFREQMEEKMRERWQEMGLSEEEIAEREQRMEERYQRMLERCAELCPCQDQ